MKTWQKIRDNPEILEKYLVREKVIDAIRVFFKGQGFAEVQTPILVPIPSAESNLEVFESQLRTSRGEKRRGFLIMSPEYALKKLVAAGVGNVFEITRAFRNEEEVSAWHNPEFTILEWYRVGADYKKIMEDFESLFVEIIKNLGYQGDLGNWEYRGETYDIGPPWPRFSCEELGLGELGEEVFYKKFFNEVEPRLRASKRPAFVYDYPVSQAALARKAKDPKYAERFEVFLAGLELGNCFSELTDANEQRLRFQKDLALRRARHKTEYPVDEDLLEAIGVMPEVAGIAVGVDRLIMLAADVETVGETLFFPAKELFEL